MRVLHVTPYFAPAFSYGGPPRSVLGLCQGLRRVGVEARVLTTAAGGDRELPPEVTGAGSYEGVPATYIPRSFPRNSFRAPALAGTLRVMLPSFDLVHIHGCWNFFCWTAARVCRREGVPYVLSPRGMLEPWSFGHSRWKKWLAYWLVERANLRAAALLHVTSDEEKRNVNQLNLGPPTVMVPNGINTAEFQQMPPAADLRERLGVSPDDFVVLYLGRLHPKKGVEILGEAFRLLLRRCSPARLLIAGPGEPTYVASLADRFRSLTGAGRCFFLGAVEGRSRLGALAAADVLGLTSFSENFGLVIGEALSAGLPVVLSRECPWPQIEEWQAGFRVANTPEAVADALARLAADPGLRRHYGANGRRGIEATLGWSVLATRMAETYDVCLAERRRRLGALAAAGGGA